MLNVDVTSKVRVFASPRNWIESNAVSQLRGVSEMPGMQLAVGLPDLHPGKGGPIGAAFVSEGIVYPHLVGNDVGCGMGLWKSGLMKKKLKLDRWENKLCDLELPWDGDHAEWMARHQLESGMSGEGLGTIGGGNHFAELQVVESVEDRSAFLNLGLDENDLVVLVHSGSRGLGQAILRAHMEQHGYAGLDTSSDDAHEYLAIHDAAVLWAKANRALIAHRFLNAIGSDAMFVADMAHNFVAKFAGTSNWVHRKGATPADQGAVLIPGSRGSLSYLVRPSGDQVLNAGSLSHGAGRKWARGDCKGRLSARYDQESMRRTDLGSRVICEDRDLLYEEAPQAYKNIEIVIQDLLEAGLISIVALFRPLITYKTRRIES